MSSEEMMEEVKAEMEEVIISHCNKEVFQGKEINKSGRKHQNQKREVQSRTEHLSSRGSVSLKMNKSNS